MIDWSSERREIVFLSFLPSPHFRPSSCLMASLLCGKQEDDGVCVWGLARNGGGCLGEWRGFGISQACPTTVTENPAPPDLNRRESYWSCNGKSRAGLHPGVQTRPSELASFPPSFMLAPVLSATDRSLATWSFAWDQVQWKRRGFLLEILPQSCIGLD